MEDFIRVWPNKVSAEDCNATIAAFERIISDSNLSSTISDNTKQFSNSNLGRKDLAVFLANPAYNEGELCSKYLYYLHDCLLEYIEEFGQLKGIVMSNHCDLKLQRTLPMGGYHTWHYESANGPDTWSRELVWMIYLNDLPENEGETEFLYQRRRIRPTQGTIVFWPAGLTHVHRGLTVYTHPKYVLTGWYKKTEQ